MNPISIITCCVGIIGCVIGVATFVSAQLSKAKQDGALMEKVDYLVRGFDEQKKDQKQHNDQQDGIISEHAIAIENLQTRMKNVEKAVFNKHEWFTFGWIKSRERKIKCSKWNPVRYI